MHILNLFLKQKLIALRDENIKINANFNEYKKKYNELESLYEKSKLYDNYLSGGNYVYNTGNNSLKTSNMYNKKNLPPMNDNYNYTSNDSVNYNSKYNANLHSNNFELASSSHMKPINYNNISNNNIDINNKTNYHSNNLANNEQDDKQRELS